MRSLRRPAIPGLLCVAILGVAPQEIAAAGPSHSARPFATVGGLDLLPPADRVVRYAYHESLFRTARALRPRGTAIRVDNPRFRPNAVSARPKYIVMSSRGRGTGPTTAVDVVMRRGTSVTSPVDGRIVNVKPYLLYCSRPDVRLVIKPAGHPDRRLVIFHVDRVRVGVGDVVEAGKTVLAIPRVFPGSVNQADTYVPGDHPHVHIEVERSDVRPLPGCQP